LDALEALSVKFYFAFAARKTFRPSPLNGVKKRVLSSAGRAAIAKAAKKRWAQAKKA
jgi:hypothetical protein